MAAITKVVRSRNPQNITPSTLSVADTLTYEANKRQELIFENTTASPIVVTIDGAGATNVPVRGTGGQTFDVSGGRQITVPGVIGAQTRVELDQLTAYLVGDIAVTGGVGLKVTWLSD